MKLVVTADDLGYNPERDRGIVECFQRGAISRSSLLVNGVSAHSAAQEAADCGLPLGLHFNITEGSPVSPKEHVSSLLNEEGYFLRKGYLRPALLRGQYQLDHVRTELEAQIKAFQEITGHNPCYVDGHQHCHVLPGIAEVFAATLQSYGIHHSRMPYEPSITECSWVDSTLMGFLQEVMSDCDDAKLHFSRANVRCSDAYVGLCTMGTDMTFERVKKMIISARDATGSGAAGGVLSCEMMTHPGYPCVTDVGGCGEGPDGFSKSYGREHEINILTSKVLQDFYVANNISLAVGIDY